MYPEGIRGGSEVVPEKGVEIRHYVFKETGEELPYSVYVSSKIKKGKKAPLVIALRGYTGTTLTFVRGTAVDLAEEGGYILVGAIGYNNRAWFGMDPNARGPGPGPALARSYRRPRCGRPPGAAPARQRSGRRRAARARWSAAGRRRGARCGEVSPRTASRT